MKIMKVRGFITIITGCLVSLAAAVVSASDTEGLEFFEKRVRPVLLDHCAECHSAATGKVKGGLDLDSREGWQKGGETGPAIIPGKPEESLLIIAVRRHDKDLAMPPKKELAPALVQDLVTWVTMGAPDPRSASLVATPLPSDTKPSIDLGESRKQWAYRRPELPAAPEVRNVKWPLNPIDRFVLSRLEASGVNPSSPASPTTLVRRLTYDLTGLPPTVAEVAAFESAALQDRRRAVRDLVDQLLDSPHYGEKWGRHWLDVVRYADSLDARGQGKEGDILDAWRYRDWVVQAFNRDLPYDEFIRQQMAGDILARQGEWDAGKVIATGMYAIGNWGNGDSDKQKVYTDIVDDQIDVTSRAFLGLTLACARCHDHKFDPLSTADYYAMSGFFFSSHILDKFAHPTAGEKIMRIPLLSPAESAERELAQQRLAAIDAELNHGLTPFEVMEAPVSGVTEVVSWHRKGGANPTLLINRSASEKRFSTITLPPKSISLHPGPRSPVTVAWKAPADMVVALQADMTDADGNCGDGIQWVVRSGTREVGRGAFANGRSDQFTGTEVSIGKGALLALSILPGKEYTCDSTIVSLQIKASDGRTWDLSQALITHGSHALEDGWLVCEGEGSHLVTEKVQDATLAQEQTTLRARLVQPTMAHGLQEGGISGTRYEGFHDAQIHVRGSYARLAATQPRGYPALFATPAPTQLQGSGRLELAKWIASSDNPLTSRVMVNRIWQHHFGTGIVRTANNFGKLGEPPTHPELLDWLALQFIKSGWSSKAMHRLICNSAAYQQSSESSPAALAADPGNHLFSRQNRRKLTAEELRDTLLIAGGQLDRQTGGVSVNDLMAKRRTLYLTAVRSDRSSFRMLFDGSDPNTIVEARNDSVVAPQALWILNHPFALEQARAFAQRIPSGTGAEPTDRVVWLYQQLFHRNPSMEEQDLALQFITRRSTGDKPWEMLCHALLCSNEFLFVD